MVAVGGPVGSLCAKPTQPANQRWACVPERSLGSSLRTAGVEREQLRREAAARPLPIDPFSLALTVVVRSLHSRARVLPLLDLSLSLFRATLRQE